MVYLNCLNIDECISLNLFFKIENVSILRGLAKMNPTEPVKRLKFGFIFLCSKYGFKPQANSKRDLNPRYYLLYDLKLSIGSMFTL